MSDAARKTNFFILRLMAYKENLGIVRLAVTTLAAQLDFTLQDLEEIKVAVNEAVTNVVVHAYPAGTGLVTVEARLEEDDLTVTVTDEGIGITDIRQAREAAFSTDPQRMGMGFTFMETFMDNLQVHSQPGEGTTVVMRKHASRNPVPAAL